MSERELQKPLHKSASTTLGIVRSAAEAALFIGSSHIDQDVTQLSREELLQTFYEETERNCIRLCAITLANLQSGWPQLFEKMGIIRSQVGPRTEGEYSWNYDSYFIVKAIDGTYIAGSPAMHRELQEGEPLVSILVGEDVDDILQQIKQERPGWKYARPAFIQTRIQSNARPTFSHGTSWSIRVINYGFLDAQGNSTDKPMEISLDVPLNLIGRMNE